LRRTQEGVQVLKNIVRNAGAAMAPANQGAELRVADFDEGKLRGHKEAVEQNQGGNRQNPQTDG